MDPDNKYTIRRAVRQLGGDMPPAFYGGLPALAAPEWAGAPRALVVAHGFLEAAHIQVSLPATPAHPLVERSSHRRPKRGVVSARRGNRRNLDADAPSCRGRRALPGQPTPRHDRMAAYQFEEGDVMHSGHEPEGRGVRSRCSDDMLWLVHATRRYIRATGDSAILDQGVPFLGAPPLGPDEDDCYAAFEAAPEAAPLFEHCLRATQAIAAALRHLVYPALCLVRLLTPPFDRTPRDPRYIRAYPPGVCENGGQYTHAATWPGIALARLGDGVWRIFDLINPTRRSADPAARDRYRAKVRLTAAEAARIETQQGRP